MFSDRITFGTTKQCGYIVIQLRNRPYYTMKSKKLNNKRICVYLKINIPITFNSSLVLFRKLMFRIFTNTYNTQVHNNLWKLSKSLFIINFSTINYIDFRHLFQQYIIQPTYLICLIILNYKSILERITWILQVLKLFRAQRIQYVIQNKFINILRHGQVHVKELK